jgi:hypothetical protein
MLIEVGPCVALSATASKAFSENPYLSGSRWWTKGPEVNKQRAGTLPTPKGYYQRGREKREDDQRIDVPPALIRVIDSICRNL